MAVKKSKEPFHIALQRLLTDREMSQRALARATEKECDWGSSVVISRLMRAELPPSERAMESIATALRIPPEHFAEYRLAMARARLDPQRVGFERALRALGE
jgi:transcriptional regulator with XRE-family HTH domain